MLQVSQLDKHQVQQACCAGAGHTAAPATTAAAATPGLNVQLRSFQQLSLQLWRGQRSGSMECKIEAPSQDQPGALQ